MSKRFSHRLSLCAVFALGALCMLAFTETAHAQEQFRAATWNRLNGSVGLRFGTDDLNLGFGLHGGYTIDPGVYVGGLFDYFLGDSEEAAGVETSFSAWMLMVEGGYDFGLAENFIVRPVLVLGVVGASGEVCTSNFSGTGTMCADDSGTDFELGLGGHALYVMDTLTLGAELRLIFGDVDAFMFGANVGVLFEAL